jgi:urease accessory protein
VSGAGLSGHLDLVCAPDARGFSALRRQSFRAPMHLSKPYHDEGTLVANVVNPTAGLLEGDRVECHIRVESGARLLLTTPSATRVHTMRNGSAQLRQRLEVCSGASLEFWPELFIPQRGARYTQSTQIHVEPGAELLFFESLAPGRVASGESFQFTELTWETDVLHDSTLIARERYRLTPESESIRALRSVFPDAYYGSAFIVSPRLQQQDEVWQRLHNLQASDTWIGCTHLHTTGWAIKVIASGSIPLRRSLKQIRAELYSALNRRPPSLRR